MFYPVIPSLKFEPRWSVGFLRNTDLIICEAGAEAVPAETTSEMLFHSGDFN